MSERQNTLFKRMVSAKERYTKTRKALDGMLLHSLHSQGVYTPDQFDKVYTTKKEAREYVESKLRGYNQQPTFQSQGGDN